MESNPYAGSGDVGIYTEPERTSIAAVLSLICSLICCLPAVPLLGIVLGALALIGIGRSRGRVGGKGLAVAGIVLGVLFTVAQVGIGLGMKFGFDEWIKMHAPIGQVFTDIQNDQFDAARTALGGDFAAATDDELAAFRDAYLAEAGAFVSPPQTIGEIFGMFEQIGPAFQSVQGRPNFIPAFMNFDSGPVLVGFDNDPFEQANGQSNGQGIFSKLYVADLIVVMPNGDVIELSDYVSEAPADAPPTPGPEPESDSNPDAEPDGP